MKYIFVLALCVASAFKMAAETPVKLSYIFTPDVAPSVPVLHVKLVFRGNRTGRSTLILPTTWAGQRDLFGAIHDLKSLDSATVIKASDNEGSRLLQYPPDSKVTLSYDLVNDWTGPLRPPKQFRVVLLPTDFIFNGSNGLVHPDIAQTAQVKASFTWKNLPRDWIVVSSFGTKKTRHKFRGQWQKVSDAMFAAGDFRSTTLESDGEKLTLAARGSWVFSDHQAAEEILSIFRVEREFWGERKPDSFVVVLTPFDQDSGFINGTVFTRAALLYLSKKQTLQIGITSVLAHEVFHTWNPYRMGRPGGEDGDAEQWFTEGFTSYYQDRILLKAGLLSYPQYIERLNWFVSVYWSNPERNSSQKQWLEQKRSGSNAGDGLPYNRGAMVALWLDQQIRKNSADRNSLDDRMFALTEQPNKELTTDFLLSFLSDGLPAQSAASLRSFVEDGVTIPLPAELQPNCGTLVTPDGSNPHYKSTGAAECQNQLASRGTK